MNISKEPTTHTEGNWNNQYKTLSNNDLEYSENSVRFYLQDGTSINGYINNNDAGKKRFIIMVDINGDKSPNQFGRDIFQMSYYIHFNKLPELNGKLVPTGIENTREELLAPNDYMCNKASSGSRCAALIMKDGWQILDDYPW